MTDISQLEGRIAAALDRIAWSVENQPAATAPVPEPEPAEPDSDLVEELEVERATNARLVASREKHVARIERLETRVLRLTERLQGAELENTRLESVITMLSQNNAMLRAANTAHQGAGETADQGVLAQLEDLRASRARDLQEMEDILADLAPLVKEA